MSEAPTPATDSVAFRRLQASLERPAAVFAALCSGDAVAGDRAVAEAMRVQSMAPGLTVRALAMRFWRGLLASPGIRLGPMPPLPAPLAHLGRLPPGLRVLVLLKLLSGLSEVELAALLGRSPMACRRALARAEALAGDTDWQAWPPALAVLVQAVSPARLVNIASWRSLPAEVPPGPRASDKRMSRGYRRALTGVAVLTVIALAVTAVWPWGGSTDDAPKIRTRELAEEEPKSRFDANAAIAMHPDRALLEISDADAAIARDTAFYAWYQAERLGTATYEPPSPTFEAPENAASTTDMGGQDAP